MRVEVSLYYTFALQPPHFFPARAGNNGGLPRPGPPDGRNNADARRKAIVRLTFQWLSLSESAIVYVLLKTLDRGAGRTVRANAAALAGCSPINCFAKVRYSETMKISSFKTLVGLLASGKLPVGAVSPKIHKSPLWNPSCRSVPRLANQFPELRVRSRWRLITSSQLYTALFPEKSSYNVLGRKTHNVLFQSVKKYQSMKCDENQCGNSYYWSMIQLLL